MKKFDIKRKRFQTISELEKSIEDVFLNKWVNKKQLFVAYFSEEDKFCINDIKRNDWEESSNIIQFKVTRKDFEQKENRLGYLMVLACIDFGQQK